MFAKFDYFDKLEQPILVLCNPNNDEIGTIQNISALSVSPTFNAVSELSFTVADKPHNPVYDSIALKRQVLIKGVKSVGENESEDLGYFIITSCDVKDGADGNFKVVLATSCEIELNNLDLPYIATQDFGTYKLWDSTDKAHSLVHQILPAMPAWSVNPPTQELGRTQRTFDNPEGTIYSFLMNDLAGTYECLVEFDILNRVITFISKLESLVETSVFLSRANFLNEVSVKEDSGEYANCISVSGGDDMTDISRVNPMGNNLLFDYSHDISRGLFSIGLEEAINLWKANFIDKEPNYLQAQRIYIARLETCTNAKNNLDEAQIVLSAAQETHKAARVGKDEVLKTAAAAKLTEAQTTYDSALVAYNTAGTNLTTAQNSINSIRASVQFNVFLTTEQLKELSRCTQQASYKDEYIVLTESMTQNERLDQMVILYEKTKRLLQGGTLDGINEPRREVSVDTEDFAFKKAFSNYGSQLEIGCLIDIEEPGGDISKYILQQMSVDYVASTVGLTFGNRYRVSNPSSVFGDLYDNTANMASIVASNYIEWGAQVHRVNELKVEREGALQLNSQRVISSINQRQLFDDRGSKFLSTNPLTGEVNGYGIAIADGTMMFFDDYSAEDGEYSGKMAIGRTINGNGDPDYGMIGGSLVVGSVTADKIVAGSMSKGTNLVYDGSFEGSSTFDSASSAWQNDVGSGDPIINRMGGFDGYQFLEMSSPSFSSVRCFYQKTGHRINVSADTNYYASFYYKLSNSNDTNANTSVRMIVEWYDESSNQISAPFIFSVDKTNIWKRVHGLLRSPENAKTAVINMTASSFIGSVSFDGIMLEKTAILNEYSPHFGQFAARYTVINDEGIKVRNGKIEILNNVETPVLNADTSGNLQVTGKITATSGNIGGWLIEPRTGTSEVNVIQSANHQVGLSPDDAVTTSCAIWAGHTGKLKRNPWEQGNGWEGFYNFSVSYDGFLRSISGLIGGWGISSSKLSAGEGESHVSISAEAGGGNSYAFWCGDEIPDIAPFNVRKNGTLTATEAHIEGYIKATSGEFTGTVTATSGTIGGWSIGASGVDKYLYSGNGANRVALNASDYSDVAIWCGADSAASAPFRVTKTGTLTALDAHIEGKVTATSGSFEGTVHATDGSFTGMVTATSGTIGGWNIGTGTNGTDKYLYSGSGANKVALNASDYSDVAIWCGSETTGAAPFKVTKTGTLTATDAYITGKVTATSGSFTGEVNASSGSFTGAVYASSGSFTGAVYASSGSFTGAVTATSGTIGGWNIGTGPNGTDKYLYSGSGGNRIALNASDYSPYAIWFGSASTTDAPFKVTKTGHLYALSATIKGTLQANTIISDGVKIGNGGLKVNGGRIYANPTNYIDTNGSVVTSAARITGGSIQIGAYDGGGSFSVNSSGGILIENTINIKILSQKGGGADVNEVVFMGVGNSGGTRSYYGQGTTTGTIPSLYAGMSTYVAGGATTGSVSLTGNNVYINGNNIYLSGGTWISSKEEAKKGIVEYLDTAKDKIKSSKIYKYAYKKDKNNTEEEFNPITENSIYGLVIDRECPDEVLNNEKTAVNPVSMISMAWKAIQELSDENDTLKAQISALDKRLSALEGKQTIKK